MPAKKTSRAKKKLKQYGDNAVYDCLSYCCIGGLSMIPTAVASYTAWAKSVPFWVSLFSILLVFFLSVWLMTWILVKLGLLSPSFTGGRQNKNLVKKKESHQLAHISVDRCLKIEVLPWEANRDTPYGTLKCLLTLPKEEQEGMRIYDVVLAVKIHNVSTSKEVKGIRLKILDIQPPLEGEKKISVFPNERQKHVSRANTDECDLKAIGLSFRDVDGDTLNAGASGTVHLLNVIANPTDDDLSLIRASFFGQWKSQFPNEFAPKESHTLTLELTASGHPRIEEKYKVTFSGKAPIVVMEKHKD